jgi:hypothetical protein
MLEVEEHLENAQSNFFSKAIIEEQAKSIVFTEQEEKVIEKQKNRFFGGDGKESGNSKPKK